MKNHSTSRYLPGYYGRPHSFRLHPLTTNDMPPDNVVRWGILGTANIAIKLAAAIAKAPSAKVVAVASRTLERAEQWSAEIGLSDDVVKYGSYMEILRDPSVDVMYVPLPTSMHREWVPKCAKAGKHVLCEKPVSEEIWRGKAVIEAKCGKKTKCAVTDDLAVALI